MLSLRTKKILFKKKLDAPIFSSPIIKNGKIYIGTISGKLYCLDQKEGFRVIWEKDLEGRIVDNSPVFYKESLFIGTFAGNLYNISSLSGEIIKQVKVDGEIDTPIVLKDNMVYVKAKDFNAFDVNHRKIWSRKINFDDEIYYQDDEILLEKDNKILYVDFKNGRMKKYYTKDRIMKLRSVNDRIFMYNNKYINLIN